MIVHLSTRRALAYAPAALRTRVLAGLYPGVRRVHGGPHRVTAMRIVMLLAGYLGLLVASARAFVALGLL